MKDALNLLLPINGADVYLFMKSTRMKRILFTIVVFTWFGTSCSGKKEKIQPTEEKIVESVYASGSVKARDQYQVYATVSGLVDEVFVTEGDTVSKGMPIFRLSSKTVRLNTENARLSAEYAAEASNSDKIQELQLNIDLAKAKMDNDRSILDKQRNLWANNIGTRNELDQRELALKNSTQAYEAARLRLTQLQKQINFQARQSRKNLEISNSLGSDYLIKSETSGRVYSLLKEKGELVSPQQPVAVIGNAQAFYLELQVDEYDIARVKPGQKIMLTMDSYKGEVFEARVDKIIPIMNERSKSFKIEATFQTQPSSLYPNLTCEANIIIMEKDKALTIPRGYLLEGDSVILENKEKRKITTGLKDYQKVEVTAGLQQADWLLKPGQ